MDILMLLKVLPFAVIGVLYALWRFAAYNRDKAREERDSFKASYELEGEVREIEKKGDKDAEAIDSADLSGIVDILRGVMRHKPKG